MTTRRDFLRATGLGALFAALWPFGRQQAVASPPTMNGLYFDDGDELIVNGDTGDVFVIRTECRDTEGNTCTYNLQWKVDGGEWKDVNDAASNTPGPVRHWVCESSAAEWLKG
jgi:hypothetical protein